jgi:hypothetical protein
MFPRAPRHRARIQLLQPPSRCRRATRTFWHATWPLAPGGARRVEWWGWRCESRDHSSTAHTVKATKGDRGSFEVTGVTGVSCARHAGSASIHMYSTRNPPVPWDLQGGGEDASAADRPSPSQRRQPCQSRCRETCPPKLAAAWWAAPGPAALFTPLQDPGRVHANALRCSPARPPAVTRPLLRQRSVRDHCLGTSRRPHGATLSIRAAPHIVDVSFRALRTLGGAAIKILLLSNGRRQQCGLRRGPLGSAIAASAGPRKHEACSS